MATEAKPSEFNRRVRQEVVRIVGGHAKVKFYRDSKGRWNFRVYGGRVILTTK